MLWPILQERERGQTFTIDILVASEEISRKVTNLKSRAVRKLAQQIKLTLNNLRLLFRKYAANIEMVDPQLKNNTDLSDALLAFEKAWEKGKSFFLNTSVYNMLLSFSLLIEGLCEKYKEIQEKFESMDTDVFIIIPRIVTLRSLDDNNRNIFELYFPELSKPSSEKKKPSII